MRSETSSWSRRRRRLIPLRMYVSLFSLFFPFFFARDESLLQFRDADSTVRCSSERRRRSEWHERRLVCLRKTRRRIFKSSESRSRSIVEVSKEGGNRRGSVLRNLIDVFPHLAVEFSSARRKVRFRKSLRFPSFPQLFRFASTPNRSTMPLYELVVIAAHATKFVRNKLCPSISRGCCDGQTSKNCESSECATSYGEGVVIVRLVIALRTKS